MVGDVNHWHLVIWRYPNKQVRSFTIENEPKLPSRPQFDVKAAVAKERSKSAALSLLLIQPAPRQPGWTAAIHRCDGIIGLVGENEYQRGQCFEHVLVSCRLLMSAMGRKQTFTIGPEL